MKAAQKVSARKAVSNGTKVLDGAKIASIRDGIARNAAERELLAAWRRMKSRHQQEAFFVTAMAVQNGGLTELADARSIYQVFPELRSRKGARS